jgi:hypothetical protein
MAAYRYHITRMHSLPLDPDKKQKEWKTIQTIAKNNHNNCFRNSTDRYSTRSATKNPKRKMTRSGR